MLIGIDASSTATGYSFGGVKDSAPRGGVWRLPGADEHVFDITLGRIGESVSELCRMIRAEHVAIEANINPQNGNTNAHTVMALAQVTGAIRSAAKRAGCSISLRAVNTIRKHFIGVGNLPSKEAKAAVMERCRLLGWDCGDSHDRADSIAVWSYEMSLRYPRWAPRATPLFKGAA